MKNIFAFALSAMLLVAPASANLVSETKTAQAESQQHNATREAGFNATERELKAKLEALKAQQVALEAETEQLSDAFSANEETLAALEETLRLETGSLGEVFGVVRQAGREVNAERYNAPATINQADMDSALDAISDAKSLPSLPTLSAFWKGMKEELKNSGEIGSETVSVRDNSGVVTPQEVLRLGNIGLVNNDGYLEWDSARQQANLLPVVEGGLNSTLLFSLSSGELALVDPTRGTVIKQLANTPTLADRFDQGGIVGKIIAALLVVGLIIALVRGFSMFRARIAIAKQIKTPMQPGDNPLGRILNVYRNEPDRSLDTLELRLMEAIMDEQQHFEKGLSMLKLLAALAPMLGLLGTVTGMIETFQVITQYGNGDPTIMAGGISMALVTTVLGLVAAIPLLLTHNILSTQADTLRGTLEKVGVSLVAEQSETSNNVRPIVKLA
ncbi:MotA/TolQ/ExbB proton channel family protein [Grimontia kaedaensis]|uniref:MotA/TolQ/ExbB proton channel family protein n=1 Tax=Grimontia kaedaensis TaxID=2872157 RepID=A0ABY4X0C6_9GAMM|nr:MotA/TolQ/ExbB proton channel family protein [Grimontia kaedaensis]USH04703.1 MotA/TolQ/ExbB proton channel family protein [Grimontia kaedaensis]